MSVTASTKGEKSKKFQSLNINTLYQGPVTKPLQQSTPPKHGLQSLGKIPTARRAPANLPSLKAENCGNEASIPFAGGNSSGWIGKEENESEAKEPKTVEVAKNPSSVGVDASKTWQVATDRPKPQSSFLSQRSQLFGKEFPSLNKEEARTKEAEASAAVQLSLEAKYGPGPILRPQTFGNWLHGGSSKIGGSGNQDDESGKDDKSHSDASKPTHMVTKTLDRRSGNSGKAMPTRELVFQPSIIDNEKLKKMDYMESNEDDWTKNDDNFDYNKKLTSYDEDERSTMWEVNNKKTSLIPPVKTKHCDTRRDAHAVDDEEQRRVKKKEEVLKNIERARKRREEEESKYRSEKGHDLRYREQDETNILDRNEKLASSSSVNKKSPAEKKPIFGTFDVGANGGLRSEGSKSFEASSDVSAKPHGQRFKRQGGELQSSSAKTLTSNQPKEEFHSRTSSVEHGFSRTTSMHGSSRTTGDKKRELNEIVKEDDPDSSSSMDKGRDKSLRGLPSLDHEEKAIELNEHKKSRGHDVEGKKIVEPRQSNSDCRDHHGEQHGQQRFAKPAKSIPAKYNVAQSESKADSQFRKYEGQASSEDWVKTGIEKGSSADYRLQQEKQGDHSGIEKMNYGVGAEMQDKGNGWFVPRGLPSRRGRGGNASIRPRAQPRLEEDINFEKEPEHSDGRADDASHLVLKQSVKERNIRGPEKALFKPGCSNANGPRIQKKRNESSDVADRERKGKVENDDNFDYRSKCKEDIKRKQFESLATKQQSLGSGPKQTFERRQNMLPPRLAKQREQNRIAQKGCDVGWGLDCNEGHWRSSCDVDNLTEMLDQLEDLKDAQILPTGTCKQLDESHKTDLPVQTIIFENTNFKGTRSGSADKSFRNDIKTDQLHLPMGFAKPEDSADLKLDFNFESEISAAEDRIGNSGKGLSGHPSTEDLNLKIASVKKVWDLPSMSPIAEGQAQAGFSTARFQSGDDMPLDTTSENLGSERHETTCSNVAKVRPQQQQPPMMSQMGHPGSCNQNDYDRMMHRSGTVNYSNRGLVTGTGHSTMPSPPPILASQPPSLYQAFQLDGRSLTSPMYPSYTGLGGQSVMLQSSATNDIFGAASTNQFRLQPAGAVQFSANPQYATGNAVLISQPGMMASALKQQNQIGPIGTKTASGQFQQSGLGTLPVTAATSPMLIQYDNAGNPINYLPNAFQRSTGQHGQTAFYQALAANSQQGGNRQQFSMQGFATSGQPGMQHLNVSAQLRGQMPQDGLPRLSSLTMEF